MNVEGEGTGADNESCIVSEVIEEDVMYFYGNGSGSDCLTGNQSEKEEETKTNSKSDSNSVEKTEVDNNPATDTKPAENCTSQSKVLAQTENHVEKSLEEDSDVKKAVVEPKCVKKTAYVCGKKDDDEQPPVVDVEAATSENIEANGDVKCSEKDSDSQVVVTEVTEDGVLPAATNGTEDRVKDEDILTVNDVQGKFLFILDGIVQFGAEAIFVIVLCLFRHETHRVLRFIEKKQYLGSIRVLYLVVGK